MRVLVVVLAATALLATTVPVATAAAPADCGLPGLVRPAGARPCPATPTPKAGNPRPNNIFAPIGHIFTSLSGKAIKGVFGALVGLAVSSAAAALRFTASLIGETTRPALESTWFSATYWRIGGISALLTLPFLFAAAVHALVRSDLALLARAAFGYLPLAMLGVAIAAPITSLVLSATDEMSAFVAAASNHSETTFLGHAAAGLASAPLIAQDPFLGFFVALITVAATVALWIELLVRAAAVEVIVLMLPLFFAAMVWPARRMWAIRAIETLFALILAKFAIVAVLSLGGAAVSHGGSGPAAVLTGAVLITLATLTPWALLRMLPMHEVAAAAAGGLSAGPRHAATGGARAIVSAGTDAANLGADWLGRHLTRDATSDPGSGAHRSPPSADQGDSELQRYAPSTQAGLAAAGGTPTPTPTPTPSPIAGPPDDRPLIDESLAPGRSDEVLVIDGEPAPRPPAGEEQ